MKYVLANIGSALSPLNIANVLKSEIATTNNKTVSRYLDLLEKSYIIYKASRFDVRGKTQLQTQEKYYAVDLGLRRLLVGQHQGSDLGHRLENIVYLELLRRGGDVWIGKVDKKEVDFVVRRLSGDIEYYQVSLSVLNEETLKRELAPFEALRDNYPKFLITTDTIRENYNGIKHLNATDWLLGRVS